MKIDYAVQIVWSVEDGAYLAIPFELPGCMADGQTPEEALANLRGVIEEWIEVAKEEGRRIPPPMTMEDFERLEQESTQRLRESVEKQVQSAIQQAVQEALRQLTQPMLRRQYELIHHLASPSMGADDPLVEPIETVRGTKLTPGRSAQK